jgi:iron complex transport system substrate-binding protein
VRRSVSIVLLALVATACAENAGVTPRAQVSASFPVTVTASNGPVTIPARPARIVSLSATATEMLFAIGAGPQVVAVDDQSNYPTTAPKTKLSGFEPNIEAIAAYKPDLLVFATDTKQLGASLQALSIPALQQDAATTLEDSYRQITQLGAATAHPNEARALVEQLTKNVRDIVASAPRFTTQLTYYHELDSTYFSVTSRTFIGTVYSLLRLRNIADPADKPDNHYPQLSPEAIIQADPDLIFLADTKCCGQSADAVSKRPGWSQITAVKTGAVVPLDDDIASRWGPRVIDFLRTVAGALRDLSKKAA